MILQRLRGLIVSIQPEPESVLNTPETIALLARCAVANGASGVRIEGAVRIAAVRAAVNVPIIGLVKRVYPGYDPYITPTRGEVEAIAAAGADVIAFDATPRTRPGGDDVAALIAAIHARGALAMAYCALGAEAEAAAAAGAEIVGTTLCGYTEETHGHALPALDVLQEAAATGAFAILEGGVGEPGQVNAAFVAGASAVVVGTALTNLDARIRAFAGIPARQKSAPGNRSPRTV
jgi:N-acylglucosamine-6-phosphate 2-epimerase